MSTTTLLFLFTLIFSVPVWVISARRGRVASPLSLLTFAYFLILVVGTILFEPLRGRPLENAVLSLIFIGFISLYLGCILGESKLFRRFVNRVSKIQFGIHEPELMVAAALVGLAAAAILFVVAGGSPLFKADVNESKLQLLAGNGHIRIFIYLLPLATLFFLYEMLRSRYLFYKYLFWSFAFLTIGIFIFSGFRGWVVLFLGQALVLFFVVRKKRVSLFGGVFVLFLIYSFVMIVGSFRRGSINLVETLAELVIIFTARPAAVEHIYRNLDPGSMGITFFGDLVKLLPGTVEGVNAKIKEQVFAGASNMPDLAGINPSIVGELYLNFGFTGVFSIMFFIGLFCTFFYRVAISSLRRSIVIFYAITIMFFVVSFQKGISSGMPVLVFYIFWGLFLNFVARVRFQISRSTL